MKRYTKILMLMMLSLLVMAFSATCFAAKKSCGSNWCGIF